jgi:hypothetical protein
MATAPKLVTIRRAHESLSAELREFLDAVVVPALLKKYVAELEEVKPAEKMLAPTNRPTAYSLPSTLSAKRQGRIH